MNVNINDASSAGKGKNIISRKGLVMKTWPFEHSDIFLVFLKMINLCDSNGHF